MVISRNKTLLLSRHFDTVIKKGHDDGAIKKKKQEHKHNNPVSN